MSTTIEAIRKRKEAGDTFRPNEILKWISEAEDAELAAIVYDVLQSYSDRIQPKLDWVALYPFVIHYLIRCIRDNKGSEYVHSGYEAAWELTAILKHCAKNGELGAIVQQAERALSRAYISGDDGVKDPILNGTLERALELPSVRPFFANWEKSPELSEAWHSAMLWARDHEDGAR